MNTFLVQSNLAPISFPLLGLGIVHLLSFGQNPRSDVYNFGMRMVLELHGARAAKKAYKYSKRKDREIVSMDKEDKDVQAGVSAPTAAVGDGFGSLCGSLLAWTLD